MGKMEKLAFDLFGGRGVGRDCCPRVALPSSLFELRPSPLQAMARQDDVTSRFALGWIILWGYSLIIPKRDASATFGLTRPTGWVSRSG
jgi:hypothetical protein